MLRIAIATALLATPLAAAETKEQSCGYQADVVRAIQQARLDRVKKADVENTIVSSNPNWPSNYNAAIAQLTPWIYDQKKRDLRNKDFGEFLYKECVENWDQIQAMKNSLNN